MFRLSCRAKLITLIIVGIIFLLEFFGIPIKKFGEDEINIVFTTKIIIPNQKEHESSDYYCNFPSSIQEEANEGIGEQGWDLAQVHVVIRHGDRSPLKFDRYKTDHVNPNFCNIHEVESDETMMRYRDCIIQDFYNKSEKRYFNFIPLPTSIVCAPGELTNIGVSQHLKIGGLLNDRYVKKHNLINPSNSNGKQVYVESTQVKRTVKSAVSLLYGMLPNYHLGQIPFHWAGTLFCGLKCNCPLAERLEPKINSNKYSIYFQRQKLNQTLIRLGKMLNYNDRTGSIIDHFILGYICKNLPLPCIEVNETCIDKTDLNVVVKEDSEMYREISLNSEFRNQSKLNMQPMLNTILTRMMLSIDGKTQIKLFLYSGHDKTITPLLQALEINDFKQPPLASRLIFELWKNQVNEYFVKVIYNGRAINSKTGFCNLSLNNCPFSAFNLYVKSRMFANMHFKSREEACY